MTDEVLNTDTDDAVDVQKLTPKFKFCCKDTVACKLCLVIDAELYIHVDNDKGSEDHSGNDEEGYGDPKGVNGSYMNPTVMFTESLNNHSGGFACLNQPLLCVTADQVFAIQLLDSFHVNIASESSYRDVRVIGNTSH